MEYSGKIMLYFINFFSTVCSSKKITKHFVFPHRLYTSEFRRLGLIAVLNFYDIHINANAFSMFYLKVYFLLHFIILIAKKVLNLFSENAWDH